MALDPLYSPEATKALDAVEHDPSRQILWEALCDAVDLICDHPDSAQARRQALRTRDGNTLWMVGVRSPDEDWVVLWRPAPPKAEIAYIGPASFR